MEIRGLQHYNIKKLGFEFTCANISWINTVNCLLVFSILPWSYNMFQHSERTVEICLWHSSFLTLSVSSYNIKTRGGISSLTKNVKNYDQSFDKFTLFITKATMVKLKLVLLLCQSASESASGLWMAFVLRCVSTKGVTFLRTHLNKASRNLSKLHRLFSESCRDTSDGSTRLVRCQPPGWRRSD